MVTSGDLPPAGGRGPDPVRAQRARIARLVRVGQRVGYGLFLLAMLGFAAGALTGFPPFLVALVVASLVLGSLVLAPAIVVAYGVRAAEREDRHRTP